MTRFARAKGSKASNERVSESSTPWNVMKQDLQKSQEELKNKKHRKTNDELRQKNYNEFVNEIEAKKEKKWAEFPKNLKTIKKKSKNVLKITENDVTEDMIQEMCHPDPQIDGKLENMTKKIENMLTKNKNKKKLKKNKQISAKKSEENDQEAPEEVSATIAPKKVVLKKAKNKKKTLTIPAADNKNATATKEINEAIATVNPKKKNKETTDKKFKNKNQQGKYVGNNNNNNQNGQKRKLPKIRDDKEHKRRKPENVIINIHGKEQTLIPYQGFPILEEDYNRLKELRESLAFKGIPQKEIARTMKLERRKAERALSRLRKNVCFQCRKSGHVLAECPEIGDQPLYQITTTGYCYKCGSTEHTHTTCKVSKDYKFANCFICKEQGHISNQCPDNPRGLYPKGGACKLCGDVTHLRKDCPTLLKEKKDNSVFLTTISDENIDSIDEEKTVQKKPVLNKKKIIKF